MFTVYFPLVALDIGFGQNSICYSPGNELPHQLEDKTLEFYYVIQIQEANHLHLTVRESPFLRMLGFHLRSAQKALKRLPPTNSLYLG